MKKRIENFIKEPKIGEIIKVYCDFSIKYGVVTGFDYYYYIKDEKKNKKKYKVRIQRQRVILNECGAVNISDCCLCIPEIKVKFI